MKEPVCISVKAMYKKFGENLTNEKIRYTPIGEENPSCEYYDLMSISENTLCMDGEECMVIGEISDNVILTNTEGEVPYTFTLTKEEYEVATFKEREDKEVNKVKYEDLIYKLVDLLYNNTQDEYEGMDNLDFIDFVCSETGMTEQMYRKIILCEEEVRHSTKKYNVWENLGDVNFIAYGGCLVRKIGEFEYNVFRLFTPNDVGEGDDVYLAQLHTIDIRDFEWYKKDILELIGYEDKCNTPYLEIFEGAVWAREITESGYSDIYTNYQGHCYDCDSKTTFKDLMQWIVELEIPKDILGMDKETEAVYDKLQQDK